jgi:hypothetical protein
MKRVFRTALLRYFLIIGDFRDISPAPAPGPGNLLKSPAFLSKQKIGINSGSILAGYNIGPDRSRGIAEGDL